MKVGKNFAAMVGGAFLIAGNANSELINYSEIVSGDLDALSPPSFTITMAGVHSWSGSASFSRSEDLNSLSDADAFQLVLEPSFAIATVDLAISNLEFEAMFQLSAQVNISTLDMIPNSIVYSAEEVLVNEANTPLSTLTPIDELPLGMGTYAVGTGVLFDFCSDVPCRSSWDWSLTMTAVEVNVDDNNSVPVPAPLAMICIGLLALGYARRKSAH